METVGPAEGWERKLDDPSSSGRNPATERGRRPAAALSRPRQSKAARHFRQTWREVAS